ncbi:hypothetical protein D3C84_801070 [compost metagenome]
MQCNKALGHGCTGFTEIECIHKSQFTHLLIKFEAAHQLFECRCRIRFTQIKLKSVTCIRSLGCHYLRSMRKPLLLVAAVDDRNAMSSRAVAENIISFFTEISLCVETSSQIFQPSNPVHDPNEMSDVIVIMRFVIMAALGRKTNELSSRISSAHHPLSFRQDIRLKWHFFTLA